MTSSSEALNNIKNSFSAYREAIDRCRSASDYKADDWKDAYARLYRIRERYKQEKPNLTAVARQELGKTLYRDRFITGLYEIRNVGEHVKRRQDFTFRMVGGGPITLSVDSSAKAMFSAESVLLTDTRGQSHRANHRQMLEEAEKRIAAAISRAV